MENNIKRVINNILCKEFSADEFPGPVVTISRQAGCSARRIAIKLSKILTGYSYVADTKTEAEWKWVDKYLFKEVINQILREITDVGLQEKDEVEKMIREVAQAFSKETIYDISDRTLLDIFKCIVNRLAYYGRIIVIGRSAGVIIKDIPDKLNVRLEAPVEWRINRIMQLREMSQADAVKYVNETDTKRDLFLERVIGRKSNNDDYDVIFNYASLRDDEIIDAIVNILKNKKIISQYRDF